MSYSQYGGVKTSVDSVYVSSRDSFIGVFLDDKQKDTIVLTIKNEISQNGTNPFFPRRDTSKYEQRSLRTLTITSNGNIEDRTIDSILYNHHFFLKVHSFNVKDDEILIAKWGNVNGGVGFTRYYKKGFYVSSPSPHGGYSITKRTPEDTLKSNLSIGTQEYLYDYDESGKVVSIISKEDSSLIYSVKRNKLGQWNYIIFRDLIIKRNSKRNK